MTHEQEDHEKYDELCALALFGGLSPGERTELNAHLEECEDCREAYADYALVARDGMPMLAARLDRQAQEPRAWDNSAVRLKLFTQLAGAASATVPTVQDPPRKKQAYRLRVLVPLAAAAGLVAILSYGTFLLGKRAQRSPANSPATQAELVPRDRYEKVSAEKKSLEDSLAAESHKVAQFEAEAGRRWQAMAQLRSELKATSDRADELAAAKKNGNDERRGLSRERDTLAAQLED